MKYIKTYKIFEANYSIEEYIDSISNELSKYNISPIGIRELIENYNNDIQDAISNNVDPYTFIKKIATDMQLSDGGGFMDQHTPTQKQTTIKYY